MKRTPPKPPAIGDKWYDPDTTIVREWDGEKWVVVAFRPGFDSVVEAVREDLLARSRAGYIKYGVTLDRTDLSLKDWLQHAYEETLDQANYLKRAIMEIETHTSEERADSSKLKP